MVGVFFLLITNISIFALSFVTENSEQNSLAYYLCGQGIIFFLFVFVTANFNTLGFVVVIYIPELVPANGVLLCF